MPSHGNYEVTSAEEGKVAERDQSFRSCVISMLIFILLSIVLILVSLPWRTFQTRQIHRPESDESLIESAKIEGKGFSTSSTEGSVEKEVEDFEPYTTYETTEIPVESVTQTEENEISFERYSNNRTRENSHEKEKQIVENDAPFEQYTNNETTEIPVSSTTEKMLMTTSQVSTEIATTLETFFSPETTTLRMIDSTTQAQFSNGDQSNPEHGTTSVESDETSSEMLEEFVTKFTTKEIELLNKVPESSTQKSRTTELSLDHQTSLQKLLVASYFGNESMTSKPDYSMEEWLDVVEVSTREKPTESSTTFSTKVVSSSRLQSQTNPVAEFVMTTRKNTTEFTTPRNSIEKTTVLVSQEIREGKIDACETGSCKQLASKILSYMNHSADPCDDFYEYACGGLEADQQINEKILLHRVYEKIEAQARKPKYSKYSQFIEYYDSCLKYESTYNFDYRINLAKRSLEKVGKFYTKPTWPTDYPNFTALFTNMLLYNSPLLFDIVPDVNEKNPQTFTLKIGPAIDENPFQSLHAQNQCQDEKFKLQQEHVDLDQLYESYKTCKKDPKVIAVTEALENLRIFEDLKNPWNETRHLEDTVTDIYHEIIEGIFTYLPSDNEIRESYRSKSYTVMTLGELQSMTKLINWVHLIKKLTGFDLGPNSELQVYHKVELTRALRRLDELAREHDRRLHNALLGLYAQNLYQNLVATRTARNFEKKCFDVAAHFMRREASLLYLSSFSFRKTQNMKNMMQSMFNDLKETLRLELESSEWAVDWGRDVLLKKLADMKMSIPEISYIKRSDVYQLNITDNYFENSVALMKKYRSKIYSVLRKDPSDPEQIWTFFASPYQSNPLTIYALNLIVVPFGAIDWPILEEKMDYMSFAIIGNLIAREIAHNFDTNGKYSLAHSRYSFSNGYFSIFFSLFLLQGIRYWNGSRDSEFALMTDSDITKSNYEDYLNCQKFSIYQEPVEMTVPLTGQQLTFRVPSLTLNERLSDAVGVRLAYDTLVRLGKGISEKRLPWLDLDVSQLYYLVYAQTHCTKEPLASSYVALNENPLMPSRMRIFVAASNDKKLGESWKCPEGSQLLPTFTCGVFPHLEYRGIVPDAA
ncbi:endothelin-converting enzyme 1-like [Venturia canescens]|uniref:endothelin-converting enzyme 1-like n=1 Tax=Venturia canescens TaxID=32260 RepID=UPI001C9CB691|nr:endothelin-converting enzyme 1-like [Venturia canescens]